MRERIPLLKDHHTHPSFYAALKSCLDLRNISDRDEALLLIRERDDAVVFVSGWNNSLYSFSQTELERLPPVFISNVSLHTFLMNNAAEGVLAATNPHITENLGDSAWVEKNLPEIFKMIVTVKGCSFEQLDAFYQDLLGMGVAYGEEMLLPNEQVLEVFEGLSYLERPRIWADPKAYSDLSESARKKVFGLKLFSDGALGARTAAISQPYISGETGLLTRSDEELLRVLEELAIEGRPIAVHAIGDRALEQIISGVEQLRSDDPSSPPVRLEHCQFITREQAVRAKEIELVLSMQPNFSSDSIGYRDRLPGDLCDRNNPFRMLIDEVGFVPGEDLILGSDGMPHGAEYALQMSLFPPLPSQKLRLEEFVAGYCMPDQDVGYLELEIDRDSRNVSVETVVSKTDGVDL
jgi:predicted amidohydrolase YtcJ